MEEFSILLNQIIPAKYAAHLSLFLLVVRFSGEAFSAIKSRGGLRGIYRGLLLGENMPRVVTDDYSKELKIPAPSPNEQTK
jgi:hypothetical protein